ncbi:hypothetical protein, partial [Winogradskyella ouciana]|uniref:hypothetical protein n=1 Tax=Winogradskyella ouciana TaxID=2608631 RepID=UPI001F2076D1
AALASDLADPVVGGGEPAASGVTSATMDACRPAVFNVLPDKDLPLLGSPFSSLLVESSDSLPSTADTAALSPPAMEQSEQQEEE